MRMTRRIIIQMAIFAVIATTALVIMVFGLHAVARAASVSGSTA